MTGDRDFDWRQSKSSGDGGDGHIGDGHIGDGHIGDGGSGQIERLLELALTVPPMSDEFKADVTDKLEAAWLEAVASAVAEPTQVLPYTRNGTASAHRNGSASADSQRAVLPVSSTTAAAGAVSALTASRLIGDSENSSKSPSLRRWLVGAVAASTLFALVGLLANGRAYGWANMIAALEKCQWVKVLSNPSVDANTPARLSWYSSRRRTLAIQTTEGRSLVTLEEQTHATELESLDRSLERDEDKLLVLLLPLLDVAPGVGAPGNWQSLPHVTVLHESWGPTSAENDSLTQLQLQLRFSGLPEGRTLSGRALFLVDRRTMLPQSVAWQAEGELPTHGTRTAEFHYPTAEPATEQAWVAFVAQQDATLPAEELTEDLSGRLADAGEQGGPRVVAEEVVVFGLPTQREKAHQSAVALHDEPDESTETTPAKEIASAESRPAPAPLPEPLETKELVRQVNEILSRFWADQGITPAPPASDAEFLRRVYLDLTGRIPMVSEYYHFMEDQAPNRRKGLVDDLLQRRDHATHLAAVWRKILLPDGADLSRLGGTEKFDAWLADRFAENASYDEVVRQLLLAEGRVSESGPLLFYAALKLNPEELAAKTSRVFLATRMECAQCHDHLFDSRISQEDFWGFAAYFAQISRPEGKMEMTSPVLRVRDSDYGDVKLPDTDTVVPPKLPTEALADIPLAPGERSRRQQLAEWLTNENNLQFARATVNRIWQQLYGRGLVEPVDDMRPDNDAICPELLELLSRDFAASGFDLRRMIRALVLTDAYQLSSASATDEPSQALCFARMNMKAFTADQLYDCIAVATRNEGAVMQSAGGNAVNRTGNSVREQFIQQFKAVGDSRTDYQAGIPQALALMHGNVVHGATDLNNSGLLKSLQAPFFSDEQRLDTAFLATLGREPTDAERETMLKYIAGGEDAAQRGARVGDVVWALLNSAEFVFIH